MSNKPIYVELAIDASLDELWKYTQSPELHEQWDLRFSEIRYLPKANESDNQKFVYRTRIGFGLRIEGTGESAVIMKNNRKDRLSTLAFASDQRLSLIRQGGGFWKYEQRQPGQPVTFSTLYDYRTRFGPAGRLFDRWLFRPLFGFATAWSFDRLRLWLEERVPPSVTAERALIHYCSVMLLLLLWCFEGIVPKLLFPESGEMALLGGTGWFAGAEREAVRLLGLGEVAFGVAAAILHRKRWAHLAQLAALLLLTIPALAFNSGIMAEPFNPLTLLLPMAGLCMAAYWTARQLPDARRCRRRPAANPRKARRRSNEIDL
ncbi:DoxX-like family protein [Paenibacillus arenilitoris]|uniref:DoxX-like family protein n=1 Tax=Paenibacillus arenilitoris TaxID=2772299 RepID=A0A927CQF0_9BACL|nr:DoxX-like family protein [Paenibacillus arenilitoris]MBD2869755.1 DoxX-like family protein [Paenibacillus arenilitoris]